MCWKRRSIKNKEISSSRKYSHLPHLQFSKQRFESDFTFFLHLFFIVETKRLLAVIWFLFIAFQSLCYFVVSKRHKNCFHLICVKNIPSYNFFSFRYSFQKKEKKNSKRNAAEKKVINNNKSFCKRSEISVSTRNNNKSGGFTLKPSSSSFWLSSSSYTSQTVLYQLVRLVYVKFQFYFLSFVRLFHRCALIQFISIEKRIGWNEHELWFATFNIFFAIICEKFRFGLFHT